MHGKGKVAILAGNQNAPNLQRRVQGVKQEAAKYPGIQIIGTFNHITILAISAMAYAALEGTEGIGLAMRRRWAEYLTVIATGILIPYEAYEVINHPTLFKVGALLLNLAVVGYLAYRKRLFVGI